MLRYTRLFVVSLTLAIVFPFITSLAGERTSTKRSSGAIPGMTAAPAAQVNFWPRVNYAVGQNPTAVAVADFDNDGKLDLVVSNNSSNSVSVLLGNGDGTFRPAADYAVGTSPQGLTTGDLNGDGKVDVVVVNNGNDTLSVLLGTGDGTFQPKVDYPVGHRPQMTVIGDLNGDGKPDLAVADYGPDYMNGTVSILLGKGDGTFQPHIDYSAGVNPVGIMGGDFNHDDKLDLAVMNNNPPFGTSILLGVGDGSFPNRVLYGGAANPRAGVVADFNGDGTLDFATAHYIGNVVSIYLGNGDGTFRSPISYPVYTSPAALAGADFNGDGKIDLVIPNHDSNTVSLLMGNGDGTFQSRVDYAAGTTPNSVATGDFNGDGATDIVVVNGSDSTVSVYLQVVPNATFTVNPPTAPPGTSLALAGSGFTPNEAVNLYAGAITTPPAGVANADSSGSFTLTAQERQLPYGLITFYAIGQSSGKVGVFGFEVTARIVMNPTNVTPGGTATALGYGFGAGEAVRIYWYNPRRLLGTVTASNKGSSSLTVTIPSDAPAGNNLVFGVGQTTQAIGKGHLTVQ
jgi:hypothetical protein